MYNEFEHEDDDWRPEKSKPRRIIERTLAIAALCIVFGIILFMTVRLIRSQVPGSMKELVWNGSALEAYRTEGEELEVRYYPSGDSFSDDSMFSISKATYIPSIGQWQATVRYNKRALRYLSADYGLEELPQGETYVFMLRDNHGNVYKDYEYTAASRSEHEYRRVIFDGVDMDDVTILTLEAYYIGDVSESGLRAELYMYKCTSSTAAQYRDHYYDTPPSEPRADVQKKPQYDDETLS